MRTIGQLMDLSGRVALVTGGAGKIGTAIVDAFTECGATAAIADRDGPTCDAAAAAGPRRFAFPVDLRDETETRALPGRVVESLGRLDVLVHCAAYVGTTQREGWGVPFDQQSVAAWDEAMRVNLTAAFALAQAARPALEAGGAGSVILVSSIYGMVGPDMSLYDGTAMQNPAAYGASKAGLIQLARHLATVLGPRVRANCLTPGGVWRGQPELFVSRYEARTPLRRMAAEEDLKGAALFLASDLSAYVTGHNLVVDGGWTAW
jgi:NAD(P)-dependent dehydrogenase (short-subunit alcohol dehydrogenase family)